MVHQRFEMQRMKFRGVGSGLKVKEELLNQPNPSPVQIYFMHIKILNAIFKYFSYSSYLTLYFCLIILLDK